MSIQTKLNLWNSFIAEWGYKYSNCKGILKYINSYPEFINQFKIEGLVKPEEIDQNQLDWLWLYSKLIQPESDFFKSYWVSIDNSFDYFIDLSSPDFTILKVGFYCIEPMHWKKIIMIDKMSNFLLALDNSKRTKILSMEFYSKSYSLYRVPDF